MKRTYIFLMAAILSGCNFSTEEANRDDVLTNATLFSSTNCGNGVLDGDEECDALIPAGITCENAGAYTGGDLHCDSSCRFDVSACRDSQGNLVGNSSSRNSGSNSGGGGGGGNSSSSSPSTTESNTIAQDTCSNVASTAIVASGQAIEPRVRVVTGPSYKFEDDEIRSGFSLGFNFSFYGVSYNSIAISSNGFIQFGTPQDPVDGCCEGQTIPSTTAPNNIAALFWEDLDAGGLYNYSDVAIKAGPVALSGGKEYGIEFSKIPHAFSTATVTGQIILKKDSNEIEFICVSCQQDNDNDGATQGVENADGTQGFTVPGRNANPNLSLTNDAVLIQFATQTSAATCE